MRHRPKFKIKLSKSLYEEMEGGGWAQQEQPALFARLSSGDNFTYEEVLEVREGIESGLYACEGVLGGGGLDFDSARSAYAALRNARNLLTQVDAYLKQNQ